MRAFARATALIFAGMLLAGCGDGGTEPSGSGSFTATLSGDVTGSKSGKTELTDEAGDFGITMTAGTGASQVVFEMVMPADPDPDTYDVVDGFFDATLYAAETDEEYYAVSGTLTITSSTATSVSGTFDLTMDGEFGGTVTFKGSFSAKVASTTGGGGSLTNGTFTATFSGGASGTATGMAWFGVNEGMFVLSMGNSTGTRVIQIVRETGGRLGTGNHTVGAPYESNLSASSVIDGDPDAGGYQSTGGSINVTGSTASMVTGTFNITMENFYGSTLTVSGSFKATCPSGTTCS